MNLALPTKTKLLLSKNNISKILNYSRFVEGRNNQTWKISNKKGTWVLKIYPAIKKNYNLRLNNEYNFLKILEEKGIREVPKAIDHDKKNNIALYSYLPGKKVKNIKISYIYQAINFIKKINKYKNIKKFKQFPNASDSCLSINNHILCVQKRIDQLKKLKASSPLKAKTARFFAEKILPEWRKKKIEINKVYKNNLEKKFSTEELIISPSDFGFNNIIKKSKNLFFVDFEYAGWDDPAKLICDFICQPDSKIKGDYKKMFIYNLAAISPNKDKVIQRVKNLLPLHQIKWCCVLLNEFIKDNQNRRRHAGFLSEKILKRQLIKSQNYFEENLN